MVSSLKRRWSSGRCQGIPPSAPITPFRAIAATSVTVTRRWGRGSPGAGRSRATVTDSIVKSSMRAAGGVERAARAARAARACSCSRACSRWLR